ncbi:hypothetical protein GGTG_00539 [Gaeumannomyces tritici R3-111a-1]|uniref:Uncharacterized protein n=1 Tax=Gaeumannomyces tritici (strain R3-111a-1) TaxID=644352 RepID=J3NH03_GAET3|nr:hypothetical protein GGTG_00539 [Gaeumannomyces tritici R3-111a-1]EJT80543.1 hypothetical protein GGTG_00539 [Gaeumannomyces tritici R3-111a-1]
MAYTQNSGLLHRGSPAVAASAVSGTIEPPPPLFKGQAPFSRVSPTGMAWREGPTSFDGPKGRFGIRTTFGSSHGWAGAGPQVAWEKCRGGFSPFGRGLSLVRPCRHNKPPACAAAARPF